MGKGKRQWASDLVESAFVMGPESENLKPAELGAWSSGQHAASGPEAPEACLNYQVPQEVSRRDTLGDFQHHSQSTVPRVSLSSCPFTAHIRVKTLTFVAPVMGT